MAAPGDDEQDRLPQQENAPAQADAPLPARRRRSIVGTLFSTLMLLALLAGGLGFAAIALKDKDERIALVAGYAEQALAEAETNVEKAKVKIAELLGEARPAPTSKVTTHRTATIAEAPEAIPSAESRPAPAPSAEPESAPLPPPAPVAGPALEPPPAPPPVSATAPSPPPAVAAAPEEPRPSAPPTPMAAINHSNVEARLTEAAETARRALAAAEAAQAAAEAAGKSALEAAERLAESVKRGATAETDGLSAKDMAAALDGRIDELGNQLKALRDKLDSPKNESRAAPESESPKNGGAAATVVVAYALQRELDAGRPYVDEVAALTRLGADPGPIERLSIFAEKGAPTAAQLRETFHAVAKKIRGLEAHGGDLSERILHGASKLVRVRPVGQAEPQTIEGKLEKVEAALANDDLATAEAAFAALPEAMRSEAKEFGETLSQRIDAGKAAGDVLHNAIAALGSAKK